MVLSDGSLAKGNVAGYKIPISMSGFALFSAKLLNRFSLNLQHLLIMIISTYSVRIKYKIGLKLSKITKK